MIRFGQSKPLPEPKPGKAQPRTRNKIRGTLVGVRFQPDQLALIDAKRLPGMSRADVIRQIIGASR